MSSIRFNITGLDSWGKFMELWSYLARVKQSGKLEKREIQKILGDLVKTRFLSTEESKELSKRWFELPYQERLSHADFLKKWDFETWVDAMENAEISLEKLDRNDTDGKIVFHELSFPAGGIEALEFLVQIFEGQILSTEE